MTIFFVLFTIWYAASVRFTSIKRVSCFKITPAQIEVSIDTHLTLSFHSLIYITDCPIIRLCFLSSRQWWSTSIGCLCLIRCSLLWCEDSFALHLLCSSTSMKSLGILCGSPVMFLIVRCFFFLDEF